MNPDDDVLTNTTAAELAGVQPSTWRDYVADGRAPAPDGRVGRTPWWRRATVEAWVASRPGQGVRTDRNLLTASRERLAMTETETPADLAAVEAEALAILTAGKPCEGLLHARWLLTFWKASDKECPNQATLAALFEAPCCGSMWVYVCDRCASVAALRAACADHDRSGRLVTTVRIR